LILNDCCSGGLEIMGQSDNIHDAPLNLREDIKIEAYIEVLKMVPLFRILGVILFRVANVQYILFL
jgi:hypothetical protein